MSTLAIQHTSTDAAFIDELNAARREAIAVLRSVLASLIPKPGSPPPPSLALLREARLAACDVLALKPPAAPAPLPSAPDTPPPSPQRREPPAAPVSPQDDRTLFVPSGFGPMRNAAAIDLKGVAPSLPRPGSDALTPSAPVLTRQASPPLIRSRASAPVQALLSRLGAPP